MRTLIIQILLPVSLLAACNSENRQTKAFIPGTYVSHAQSACSIADDTLIIMADGSAYHVIRRTGFRQLKDGQLQPAEHKAKSFIAFWNEQQQALQITENGIFLLFQPRRDQVRVQNSQYRKL